MQPTRRLASLAVTLGLSLLSLGAWAQQPPSEDVSFAEEVSVDYVLVPLVVKGAKGPITDLPRDAFELLVDGHAVPIESFESGDTPATLFFCRTCRAAWSWLASCAPAAAP